MGRPLLQSALALYRVRVNRAVRLLPALLVLGFVVTLITGENTSPLAEVIYSLSVFAAAYSIFHSRRQPRIDSVGAVALAVGVTAWGVGASSASINYLGWDFWVGHPGFENAAYLLFYPLTFVGLSRLLSRKGRFSWDEILNAAIVGLGSASITAALIMVPFDVTVKSGQFFIDAVFPIADLGLFSYALASFVMLPRRNSPRAVLLVLGITFFVICDFYYLGAVTVGTYEFSGWPDLGWLIGLVLIAEAPWRFTEERQSKMRSGRVESFSAAIAITILGLDLFRIYSFSWFVLVPALATLVAVLLRLAFSLQTSNKLLDEQALARTDELTGLANRRRFVAMTGDLANQWEKSGKYGSVLLLDLDGFKEVNDTLGHQTGDELLRHLGARLQGATPRNALLARLGGDEFGLLLFNTADATGALTVAAALREALLQPVEIAGVRLRVDASVGIALAPEHGRNVSDLLRHADVAMYRAKRNRLGAAIFDAIQDTLDGDRLNLAEELADAVRHDQLAVYYQPKVDLIDGRVSELEALVRWQHPRLGLLTATDFMPIAEKTGVIVDLTRMVLAKVGDQISEWRGAGLDVSVAVNIDARELENVEIVDVVKEVITSRGIGADSLILEITEEVLVRDSEFARSIIVSLDRLGVRVSIDDFGTGYSSLSYLQHLPVHELKLDRAFVAQFGGQDREASARARAVAKSVVDLARSLGMQTTAEGVEREEQLSALRSIGCDAGQGFYFAPPLSPVSATLWLATKVPVALPVRS